ncbi:hypothetical protein QBC37DRAFT_427353 [Rhypophila decipiens]|uniref:CENP-V/GFA domain-containing protein n=1 Tax=Rhypophila decipiens TaxID=261697 RepID=A0AAN7B3B3_9PEZI|nr:hypothetical protein QBC37DRAFT_427353 [Rhypophila decipiens]
MATSTTENTAHQGAAEGEPSTSWDSSNALPEIATKKAAEIELLAQCLCKNHTFTSRVPVPTPSWPDESATPDKSRKNTTDATGSSAPLEAVYCHCTSCRRSTGGMYSVSVVWPGRIGDGHGEHQGQSDNFASLKRYKRSENSPATGLFCGTCSSLMFYELVLPKSSEQSQQTGCGQVVKHGVFLGCLSAYEIDSAGNRIGPVTGEEYTLIKPRDHLVVGDTVDGGATCWLRGWDRNEVKMWAGHRGVSEEFTQQSSTVNINDKHEDRHNLHDQGHDQLQTQADQPGVGQQDTALAQPEEGDSEQMPEYVHIKCHCEGVNLALQTGKSRREYLRKIDQKEKLPWFVNAKTGKPIGSIDGCDSCNVSSGSDLFCWTFAEVQYLSYASHSEFGSPVEAGPPEFPRDTIELKAAVEENMRRLQTLDSFSASDKRKEKGHPLGTLSLYKSSHDVQRYFCSRCSASIFYAWDDRPEMVDIAVGVVCSPDGMARAESTISWKFNGKVVWRDDILAPGSGRGWARGLVLAVEECTKELRT